MLSGGRPTGNRGCKAVPAANLASISSRVIGLPLRQSSQIGQPARCRCALISIPTARCRSQYGITTPQSVIAISHQVRYHWILWTSSEIGGFRHRIEALYFICPVEPLFFAGKIRNDNDFEK